MKSLFKKFGGAWYIETILMGLFITGLGIFLASSPSWADELMKLNIGVKLTMSSIGIVAIWVGVLELLSAKEKKNLEDTYVDPW